MVKCGLTLAVLCLSLAFVAETAAAGEIEGHVFLDVPSPPGRALIFDEGFDPPRDEPILLTQIGVVGGPPGDAPIQQWFALPDADGAYRFTDLPDDGIFEVELPFLGPLDFYNVSRIETDAMGVKMPTPVPMAPLGITLDPNTMTAEVDIPILAAAAGEFPLFVTAPAPVHVIGGVFVDRNRAGHTGVCGLSSRSGGCVRGEQQFLGEPADGIEVVLQCLDATGAPVGSPLTTIVGSDYTFVPDGQVDPVTEGRDGIFMFLDKALADGESVRISIDPSQPALAGLLPVSATTVVRTRTASASSPDDELPVVEFRFQPAFDLHGRVKLIDTEGLERGLAGLDVTLVDLVNDAVVDTTQTEVSGAYAFPDLFNSVYEVRIESGGGGAPLATGVRQIENVAPEDLDFCFDQTDCPDTTAPTLTIPADILVECAGSGGTAVSWTAPTATDDFTPDDQILITVSATSGTTFPVGTTTVTVTAADWCGNVATETFTITVQDTTPPAIACTLARTILWPPTGGLFPIGLTASATDLCDGNVDVVVTIFSNEDEDTGSPAFADDAVGTTIPGIRLRSERLVPGDGRIYLVRITARDRAGNVAIVCKCAMVPYFPFGQSILAARAQAAAAEAQCLTLDPDTGVPTGFTEILRVPPEPVEEPE